MPRWGAMRLTTGWLLTVRYILTAPPADLSEIEAALGLLGVADKSALLKRAVCGLRRCSLRDRSDLPRQKTVRVGVYVSPSLRASPYSVDSYAATAASRVA